MNKSELWTLDEFFNPPILPVPLTPTRVEKKWGYEIWWCNNNEFCGKLLHLNEGAQFSMHYHRLKREVFVVEKGRIELKTIDQRDASQHTVERVFYYPSRL